jgi:enterochelin esterase-like enzyme
LLHGYTDNETGWTQFGQAKAIADKAIDNGDAPPMIIVMPDAGVSWYVNSSDGKLNYEDFFIKELIPFVDSVYRTRAAKEFRAVAGLSMGGFGTLIMTMKHPGMFAAAAPLSAGVLTDDEIMKMPEDGWNNVWAIPFGKNLKGKERLSAHYLKNSILSIVQNGNVDDLKKVKYYIDCGDDDFLIKGNMALHAAMIDKKIPHEFRVRDGGHTWTYWRTALPEVLKFVGNSFVR